MPNVTIEVRRQYSRAEEAGIIDAVHSAMVEALKIPEWDQREDDR
jgi:phenylpyruvate tautomerase PptA (4-oxalocrotonate tautomerase family)